MLTTLAPLVLPLPFDIDIDIEVAQSCLTLCDPMDCSLPGSFLHGIFQARVLEWVAISFSRRSSQPRDWTRVSHIVGKRFTIWATRQVILPFKRSKQNVLSDKFYPVGLHVNKQYTFTKGLLPVILWESYSILHGRKTCLEKQVSIHKFYRSINSKPSVLTWDQGCFHDHRIMSSYLQFQVLIFRLALSSKFSSTDVQLHWMTIENPWWSLSSMLSCLDQSHCNMKIVLLQMLKDDKEQKRKRAVILELHNI